MKRTRKLTGNCKIALGLMQSWPKPAVCLYVLHTLSTSSSEGLGNGSPTSSWSASCLALALRKSSQSGSHVSICLTGQRCAIADIAANLGEAMCCACRPLAGFLGPLPPATCRVRCRSVDCLLCVELDENHNPCDLGGPIPTGCSFAQRMCDGKSQPGSQGPRSGNEIEASKLTDCCHVPCEARPFLHPAKLPTACATMRRKARQAAAFLLQRLLVSLRVAWPRETCSMTKPLLLTRKRLRWVPQRSWIRHQAASAARNHSSQANSKSAGNLLCSPGPFEFLFLASRSHWHLCGERLGPFAGQYPVTPRRGR